MSVYNAGHNTPYRPCAGAIAPAQGTGAASVSYELYGTEETGVQVSASLIHPAGYPAVAAVSIGSQAGQASKVTPLASVAGNFVKIPGDTMTGTLDMSGNLIDNALLIQGIF